MACKHCIESYKGKMSADDIVVLAELHKEECFTPQISMNRENLLQKSELTIHRLTTSLTKLEFAGFISLSRFAGKNRFFITSLGIEMLSYF